jgi:hypothetical protein
MRSSGSAPMVASIDDDASAPASGVIGAYAHAGV